MGNSFTSICPRRPGRVGWVSGPSRVGKQGFVTRRSRFVSATRMAMASLTLLVSTFTWAQISFPDGALDPARHLPDAQAETAPHPPLPEQYIWTAGDAAALQTNHNTY